MSNKNVVDVKGQLVNRTMGKKNTTGGEKREKVFPLATMRWNILSTLVIFISCA